MGGLWDPTSVGEEDEIFLLRVCKFLISRRVLKSWSSRQYVTDQSRQYLLVLTLGCYRWYQSQTLNKGGLWDLTSVGEEDATFLLRVCKSLISSRVLKSWSSRRYVTDQSRQYLLVLTLGCYRWYQSQTLNMVGLWDPTSVGEEDETFLMRACKSLISKRVLKPWGWRW